jgi:IS5 family transposase
MGPKATASTGDLFLDQLSALMSESFTSNRGRPATSPRLIACLLYLQYAFNLSDEEVVLG